MTYDMVENTYNKIPKLTNNEILFYPKNSFRNILNFRYLCLNKLQRSARLLVSE